MKKYIGLSLLLIIITSCEDIIAVEDISQEQVQILAPTNNATLNISQLRFSWQSVDFADNYRLQIATPNFAEATQVLEDTLLSITEFNKSLETGNYQWRIKATNSAYETSFNTQSFSVEE